MRTGCAMPAVHSGRLAMGSLRWSRWLCALLLLIASEPLLAQKDIITITGVKAGGAGPDGESSGTLAKEYPGAYVVNVGDVDVNDVRFTVTLKRPQGVSAKRPATVTLTNMYFGEGSDITVTFEPGETEKSVEIFLPLMPVDGYEDEHGEWHDLMTWSGNIPALYTIKTTHADAEYELLIVNTNLTGGDAPRQSPFATKLEVLQNTFGNDHAGCSVTRWGEYVLFKFFLATDVKISADSRYVINARFADHTGMGPDDDDYGLAQTHEVALTPINAGSVCSEAWYLYRPSPDEYLHSLEYNRELETDRMVQYPVLEVGPFEVANPAEDAVKYIFYSRADLPEESANSLYEISLRDDGLMPVFSNFSINKKSFKSGETMVITATMDNWQFVKRCQGNHFRSAFGVTLDDNVTMEPGRYTFDEETGLLTYYVTAPTVAETKDIYVDFGPAVRLVGDFGLSDKQVLACAESSFAVTVSPETATPNPITQFDIPELPADGSLIVLKAFKVKESDAIWVTEAQPKQYAIDPVYLPLDATNAHQLSYSVSNAEGANASIINHGLDGMVLNTGAEAGKFTVTASVKNNGEDQVLFSRTYTLMIKEGDVLDKLSLPVPMNHSNHYYVGTVFPKFQFEFKNPDKRPVDDEITVNYTHANGLTWSEKYKLSELQKYDVDNEWSAFADTERGTVTYDLPFSFTDEHPDATDDSQIGQTVITAKVLITVPTTEGPKETIECTSVLISDMKNISIGDYYEYTAAYNDAHPVTFTSEVMYLPRMGFTVGFEIPELNEKQFYNSLTDGDNVPEWLELQQNDYYYTANIKVARKFVPSFSKCHFFTFAQRSYSDDEVMLRELTSVANLEYVGPEGHLVFRVNGQEVTGDLNFDDAAAIENLIQTKFVPAGGFLAYGGAGDAVAYKVDSIICSTAVHFVAYDDVYEGAEVTLKCGDEVIQQTKNYNAAFFFLPPMDGRTYTVEVYFPGYDKRYTCNVASHPFYNIYYFGMKVTGSWSFHVNYKDVLRSYNNGKPWELTFPYSYEHEHTGYLYMENPNDFYLSYRQKDAGPDAPLANPLIRIGGLQLKPVKGNFLPQLTYYRGIYNMDHAQSDNFSLSSNLETLLWQSGRESVNKPSFYRGGYILSRLNWAELNRRNTLVSVVNSKGETVKNATLNFGCVDNTMTLQGNAGTTTFDSSVNAYQIATDPDQASEFIEVLAPGYQPTLARMYTNDYYSNAENRGKIRRFTIVLDENANAMKSLTLETMKRSGNLANNKMQATINYDDLLMLNKNQTLGFSETADYATVTKYMNDGKFGKDGWNGTKWVHLTGQMDCDANFDASQLRLQGVASHLEPALAKVISPKEFTTFSNSYCLFDFDLTDQIAEGATVKPLLKSGTQTLAELPPLHNQTVDLMVLNKANNMNLNPGEFDLSKVDDQAAANGTDMKDMNKAFDKFNFQLPPGLPFTVSIERDGDYFRVRGVCEVNLLPGGQLTNALDDLEDLQYYEEQFQACMEAVNAAKPADDDDFFDDIPRWPSAFVGIKGYLSGIGHINHEKNRFEVNFYDGGLTFEASTTAQANIGFGLGKFGMSVDALMAMSMGLVNTSAEQGEVALKSTKIDFVFDYQARLKVCAWAYGGIDLWIAKATAGVRGGASFDMHHRAYVTKGQTGMKTTLHAQMEAFAEARFLFFKAKKTWPIFKAHKEYLVPNNRSNPFHPDNDEPVFSIRRQNVTKSYKRLKRKVIAPLGTPVISNLNGMAQPTYLMDGKSLLFNNLNKAKDYNDDRLQVLVDGSKKNFIDTGVDAPMYDFSTSRNAFFEMAAFEQLETPLDGSAIDAMAENDQTKAVSEKSRIHIAWRLRDGDPLEEAPMLQWHTMEATNVWGKAACVNPVVAAASSTNGDFTKTARGAVVWQQGLAKFNDESTRYIDGSLMLRRHDFFNSDLNTEPIEIKRINRRNVPVDYQVAMKDDSVLVMMTLKQDVNNQNKGASVVYISVSPDDKVRERYTMIEGTNPQMVNVDGGILVAYLRQDQDGRDLVLNTVNMKGEPTGKLSGALGMDRRMINQYKLVTQKNGGISANLSNVVLLWSQSEQVPDDSPSGPSADSTTTVVFKNRIYASMLRAHEKQLYFSAPVEIATMPDDVSLVSMDGYLDGLDMKVAYCVANEEDGAAVIETQFTFTNTIDHKASFNPYDVTDNTQIPVKVTVVNNAVDPIYGIDITMGDSITHHMVTLLPKQSTEITVPYTVPDNFDGTIPYDVTASFGMSSDDDLRSRRMGAAARPQRVKQSGTQMNVRQVDMALKVLSKRTVGEVTTVVAEVNNASMLPLAKNVSVKVGLYDSPLATEIVPGTTEVTVTAADLYDATAEQKNKTKIVSLTANVPDFSQTLYLRTTPMQGGEIINDTQLSNNILPVSIMGKYLLGDVNGDGKVDNADISATILRISGKTPQAFNDTAADVNQDGNIDIADVTGIIHIVSK